MKPLSIIYLSRVILGLMSGIITAFLGFNNILQLISISLLIYLVTYYIYKAKFINKVSKPTSLLTTGIGAYFLTWIVSMVLLYNFLHPPI